MRRLYACETEQGQEAIRRRNETAEIYACIHGLDVHIDPNPLSPLAVSFYWGDELRKLAIIRNRSETYDGFRWPSVMITTKKVEFMIDRALRFKVPGIVIAGLLDNTLLTWDVVDERGNVADFVRYVSETKGDCMGSHMAHRENSHLPVEEAQVLSPQLLI